MYTTRVFEDNGGGLHAVVSHTYDGAIVGVYSDFERERPGTAQFVDAAFSGFPEADDYDPENYSGFGMAEAAEEIEAYSDLIAVILGAPDYAVELFPQRMGYAGRQLFGLLHSDD